MISISGKKGLRRLHHRGRCYRIPCIDYSEFEDRGKKQPDEKAYDDYCHQCWRDGRSVALDEDSVGTESESSSTESGGVTAEGA